MNIAYVSCIMPTANRPQFAELAVSHFLKQDYKNAELIIIDDGIDSVKRFLPNHNRVKYFYDQSFSSLGNKRNFGCEQALGDIIIHWDDDDYYAQDWISKQVYFLNNSGADICGLNDIYFFSPLMLKYWRWTEKNTEVPFLMGATLAYKKSFWKEHPFKNISIGEDHDFIWNTGAGIFAHDYTDGFCAILHSGNSTIKPFENSKHKKHAVEDMEVEYEGKNPPKIIK